MVNAGTRTQPPAGRWVALTRWAAGVIFLVFGVAKFANHAAELASFRHYPLPAPDAFVYLVGAVETGGGLLLITGLLTRLGAGPWSLGRRIARPTRSAELPRRKTSQARTTNGRNRFQAKVTNERRIKWDRQ